MGVVGKYFETFVREAIARAAYERELVNEEREKRGEKIRAGEEVLEVGHLLRGPGINAVIGDIGLREDADGFVQNERRWANVWMRRSRIWRNWHRNCS